MLYLFNVLELFKLFLGLMFSGYSYSFSEGTLFLDLVFKLS